MMVCMGRLTTVFLISHPSFVGTIRIFSMFASFAKFLSDFCPCCRFMPPVTVAPWKETLLANRFAPVCPQHLPPGVLPSNTSSSSFRLSSARLASIRRVAPLLRDQSEDCLYLNVYTPASGAQIVTQSSLEQINQKPDNIQPTYCQLQVLLKLSFLPFETIFCRSADYLLVLFN